MKRRTLARDGSIGGVGIHTGERALARFSPAKPGSGIRFYRSGREASSVTPGASVTAGRRRTTVGSGETSIQTVEHALAALAGLGVWDVRVDVEGPEMPAGDGSAAEYVKLFRDLGFSEHGDAEPRRLTAPVICRESGKAVAAFPSDRPRVSYVLDYGTDGFGAQIVDFLLDEFTFEREIAPARTFCTEAEAASARAAGFGKGATPENTLVVGAAGPIGDRFRFPDECARHKALDLVGDLALLGAPVAAHVVGIRSGHELNRRLVEEIRRQAG